MLSVSGVLSLGMSEVDLRVPFWESLGCLRTAWPPKVPFWEFFGTLLSVILVSGGLLTLGGPRLCVSFIW